VLHSSSKCRRRSARYMPPPKTGVLPAATRRYLLVQRAKETKTVPPGGNGPWTRKLTFLPCYRFAQTRQPGGRPDSTRRAGACTNKAIHHVDMRVQGSAGRVLRPADTTSASGKHCCLGHRSASRRLQSHSWTEGLLKMAMLHQVTHRSMHTV
jgi:hypothetical protein